MTKNCYRKIFSKRLGALMAVAKITRSQGKAAAGEGTDGGDLPAAPALNRAGALYLTALIDLLAALPMATPVRAQSITTTDNGGGIYVVTGQNSTQITTPTQSSPWIFDSETSGTNPTLVIGQNANSGSPDTLAISAGGVVSSVITGSNVIIGNAAGSNGLVTVIGTGGGGNASTLTNAGDFTVGNNGTGTLEITHGGTVLSSTGQGNNLIGLNTGSVGQVTVDGAGSTWSTHGYGIWIGQYGNGTLNIINGGQVASGGAEIGQYSGSSGAVTVDGNGSTWTSSGGLRVGDAGTGTLDITNGGKVSSVGTSAIGGTGGSGTVAVDGADGDGNASTWTSSGALYVGSSDSFFPTNTTGALKISSGGEVFSNGVSAIGLNQGATGTVTVDGTGSAWTNTGTVYVGYQGVGKLDITNGGRVSSNGVSYVGVYSGATGTITVDGPNSSWTNNGNVLYLGYQGNGTLTLSNGGSVSASGVSVAAVFSGSTGVINIGAAAGDAAAAPGTLDTPTVVLGTGGSLVFNHTSGSYTFSPAISGVGPIDVLSGTTALTADNSGYSGTTTLSGGVLQVSADNNLGTSALIFDGGTLNTKGTFSTSRTMSLSANGGTIETDGGTTFTVASTIADATGGTPGSLTKTGTGTLTLTGANTYTGGTTVSAGTLQLGDSVNSDGMTGSVAGNVFVGTNGALTFDRSNTYAFGGAITGTGVINQNGSGTTILTGNSSTFDGPVNVNSGILRVDGSLGAPDPATFNIASGATLSGSGTVGGNVIVANGGIVAPNASGSGTTSALTIDGNLALNSGSILNYNFGQANVVGGALNDLTIVTGNLTLAGTINVTTTPGGSFDPGIYRVISYSGSLTDNGLAIGAIPATGFSVQTSVAGEVNLVTAVAPNTYTFWNGGNTSLHGNGTINGGEGVWQASVGNTNWTDQTGAPIGAWSDGSFAIFMGAPGTVTVDNSQGQVTASGMQFAANGYVVQGDDILLVPDADGQSIIRVGDGALDGAGYTTTIAASLSGNDTQLVKADLGTLDLTGSSSFSGATTVEAGTLAVNGSLASSTVTVDNGATLGGDGTVGGIVAQSGSTVAPGNNGSIGTLSVAGNVTFNAGSFYQVALNPTSSSLINASGTATINGGTVQVLAGSGNYAPTYKYTILTADGGRTGEFDGVTSNLAFLTPALSDDANHVYLTMTRNDISFAGIGSTPNQRAAGSGVESLGSGNSIYDAVVQLDAPDARHAFDQLSGEVYASTQAALLEDSRFVREATNDRLGGSICDTSDDPATLRNNPNARRSGGSCLADRPGVWARAFGSWGSWNGDGNAAKLNRTIGGFFAGADTAVGRLLGGEARVGAVVGYSHSSFSVDDRDSSGGSDNFTVGLYGGTAWGNLALRTGAAYTYHDISVNRSVVFPGYANRLSGSTSAGTAQVYGELGYTLHAGSVDLEPFANLAYVNLSTSSISETGGAAALSGNGSTMNTTFTTLGVHASSNLAIDNVNAKLRGTLGWRHAFGDATPQSTLAFASGASFTVAGVPIARDAAVIDAGLDFDIGHNATLGISYNGQFGAGVTDNGVRATFNMKF